MSAKYIAAELDGRADELEIIGFIATPNLLRRAARELRDREDARAGSDVERRHREMMIATVLPAFIATRGAGLYPPDHATLVKYARNCVEFIQGTAK